MGLPGFTEDKSPDDWDLAMGKVIGYRTWTFRRHSLYCRYRRDSPISFNTREAIQRSYEPKFFGCHCESGLSGNWGGYWDTSTLKAECKTSNYAISTFTGLSVPDRCERVLDDPDGCGCGIWAYWRLPGNQPSIAHNNLSLLSQYWQVAGRIEGTGRVVIGKKGFRCERAKLTDLAVFRRMPGDALRELQEIYPDVNIIQCGMGFGPFFNAPNYTIHQKTELDLVYGPKGVKAPLWRKTLRVITGF